MVDKEDINWQDGTNPKTGDSDIILQDACYAVRYARHADLAEVLEMYLSALDEIKDYILEPDVDRCAREVLTAWASAPCLILEKAGQTIGFAGFKCFVPPYTTKKALQEFMFHVKQPYRGFKQAKLLSDAAKIMADKLKLPLWMTHLLGEHDIGLKAKFLKRWGYKIMSLGVLYGGKYGQ